MAVISVRELSHNTSGVVERVERGETIEITKRGRVVAVLQPVGARRNAYDELVAAGVIIPGSGNPISARKRLGLPLRSHPGEQPFSEVLEQMREEERY
jgi:prevent-host-death family protein